MLNVEALDSSSELLRGRGGGEGERGRGRERERRGEREGERERGDMRFKIVITQY